MLFVQKIPFSLVFVILLYLYFVSFSALKIRLLEQVFLNFFRSSLLLHYLYIVSAASVYR